MVWENWKLSIQYILISPMLAWLILFLFLFLSVRAVLMIKLVCWVALIMKIHLWSLIITTQTDGFPHSGIASPLIANLTFSSILWISLPSPLCIKCCYCFLILKMQKLSFIFILVSFLALCEVEIICEKLCKFLSFEHLVYGTELVQYFFGWDNTLCLIA